MSTHTSLLERLRAHDRDAWDRMVHVYYGLVFSWCVRAQIPKQDVPDVVQEVFRAVAQSLPTFRRDGPTDSFRGWLAGITRFKAADYWRGQREREAGVGGSTAQARLQQLPAGLDETSSESVVHTSAIRRALELVRDQFEPTTWQAFWRVTADGAPPRDVARDLGISVNAVYKAKSRVLARLRSDLGDMLP